MYLTMLSHARSSRLCDRVLLSGRWPKLLFSHVRPIFVRLLLCLFCQRGFKRLINGQVLAHVDRSGLLSEFQSEFRCGHSTTTALVSVIEDLRFSMTEGRVMVLVLLDFSKLFDCMDYRLFLPKLVSSFEFHGLAKDMVSTFLNGRSIVVDVDGTKLSSRDSFCGVPQGSVPSPLFFLCLSIVCPNVFVI
jgi:hypothetical protein